MKTLLTKLSLLSLVLTMGLASCTEEDGVTPGGNGVTGLSANAHSSTAINARWEGGSATDTLVATANGVEFRSASVQTVTSGGTTFHAATVSGLTLGTDYVLTVRNASGTSSSLSWAPATRWPSEANTTQTVRLFSTAAPLASQPSGLVIDVDGITAISTESADSASVDVVLGYNASSSAPIALLSPGVDGSGIIIGKRTNFAVPFNVAGGLDNDYYTGPVTGLITVGSTGITAVDIVNRPAGSEALNTSVIVPFVTGDNRYGRIELVPQADGQVYGTMTSGSKTFEYVDLKVSYQTQVGKGYVARPAARGHWNTISTSTTNAVKH
jgi:hypothetical protein